MWQNVLENVGIAFELVATWQTMVAILFGAILGTTIGAIPGLTGVMTIALVLPITLFIPPWVGIPLILAIYKSSMYGGSISAILIRTPGTPAAAMTAIDGYALKEKGQAKKALHAALFASFAGDCFSDIILLTIAPMLALIALKFGPPEFTMLIAFSLVIVSSVTRGSMLKGLIAAVLGLLLGVIGMDPISSEPRFSFGSVHMMGGLSFMPLLIGLFAISEALVQFEEFFARKKSAPGVSGAPEVIDTVAQSKEGLTMKEVKGLVGTWFRSSLIGTFLGALPGVGGAVAPFVAYGDAQRRSKTPDKFGTGILEGVVASESANNAVCGANLIPLLTLGIPGDVVAAMLMGALMVHGLRPGPLLFRETPHIIYAFFIILLMANFAYLLVGLTYIKLLVVRMARLSTKVLMPVILVICIAGAYAFNRSDFDVKVMLIFGIVGYGMRKLDYSLPSFLIAFILSPILETSFRRALILSRGELSIFVTRPISLAFFALLVASIAIPLVKTVYSGREGQPSFNDRSEKDPSTRPPV